MKQSLKKKKKENQLQCLSRDLLRKKKIIVRNNFSENKEKKETYSRKQFSSKKITLPEQF